MFWYVLLTILVLLSTIVGLVAFVMFVFSGCEIIEIFFTSLVAGIMAVGMALGATAIENANTTIDINVEQMEITKCDITSNTLDNGSVRQNCYLTVGNKYLVKVSPEQYARLNVGDIVTVEINIETRFGEEQKPIVTLK